MRRSQSPPAPPDGRARCQGAPGSRPLAAELVSPLPVSASPGPRCEGIDDQHVQHRQHDQGIRGRHMYEQPGLAEPEIDPCEIESVLLDNQALDGSKLLLAALVDIA